jgi:pimeloyl-ACP methyl ester carboxylesterase
MVRGNDRLKREFPLIKVPVFILHGTLDRATIPSGSQRFYAEARAVNLRPRARRTR